MRSLSTEARERAAAPKPTKPFLSEGEVLDGRYRIDGRLGGGGMATVYRAFHTGLEHPVAVKVVAPAIRHLPGMTARFLREARAATRLRGEHVVRVFDVGTTPNGSPYLVMELLEGKDIGRVLEDGLLPSVEDAVDWILQACEALAEVHGLGIVHRDLKPANLFLTRGLDGGVSVKLIDFGISRIDSPLLPHDQLALTNPDLAMGSPRYMPPEQMEASGSVDSRSDIWGLGAILYELFTGRAPFDGESLWDIYTAAMRTRPPLAALRPDLPADLDRVVLTCLSVEPGQRYADVAELARALAPFGGAHGAARAKAVADVLDASRGEGGGDLGDALGAHARRVRSVESAEASRIARRRTATTRTRRLASTGLVIALVAAALASAPYVRRLTTATPAPAPIEDPE
jgi:serine/threonine-protein kinase